MATFRRAPRLHQQRRLSQRGGRLCRRGPRDGSGSPGGGFRGGVSCTCRSGAPACERGLRDVDFSLGDDIMRGRRRHRQPRHGGGRRCRDRLPAVMGDAVAPMPRTMGRAAIAAPAAELLPRRPPSPPPLPLTGWRDWIDFWRAAIVLRASNWLLIYRRIIQQNNSIFL